MAWTDLTFSNGSKLTATKMTQVQSNFAALAAGEAGSPPIAVNSFMASGISSLGSLNVSSGAVLAPAPATPPANEAFRESVCRAWLRLDMSTDTIAASFNVVSITDGASGADTVVFDTDFSDSNYNVVGTGGDFTDVNIITHTHAAGSFKVGCRRVEATSAYDDQLVQLLAFGNQ